MHGFPRFAAWIPLAAALALLPGAAPAAEAPAAGHAAEAGGHGGGHGAPLKLNWTNLGDRHSPAIVALIINSVLLFWLLIHFAKAPMKSFLAERKRKLEEEMDQAFEEKVRAEGKLRGIVLRTKNLDEELDHLKEDLLRVGRDEHDRLIADAGSRAEKIRREAEAASREIGRAAAQEMRARMVREALETAGESLRKGLGPADQARLAEEFLQRLPTEGAQSR